MALLIRLRQCVRRTIDGQIQASMNVLTVDTSPSGLTPAVVRDAVARLVAITGKMSGFVNNLRRKEERFRTSNNEPLMRRPRRNVNVLRRSLNERKKSGENGKCCY